MIWNTQASDCPIASDATPPSGQDASTCGLVRVFLPVCCLPLGCSSCKLHFFPKRPYFHKAGETAPLHVQGREKSLLNIVCWQEIQQSGEPKSQLWMRDSIDFVASEVHLPMIGGNALVECNQVFHWSSLKLRNSAWCRSKLLRLNSEYGVNGCGWLAVGEWSLVGTVRVFLILSMPEGQR